jgi:hypothetical protein
MVSSTKKYEDSSLKSPKMNEHEIYLVIYFLKTFEEHYFLISSSINLYYLMNPIIRLI